MRQICFVTGNKYKYNEVKTLVNNFELISNEDLKFIEEIPEIEDSIKGNAFLKANFINKKFSVDCFSDDSGLFIEALGGDPGVRSSRYASEISCSDMNIDLVLDNLENQKNRKAFFETCICLIINGNIHYFNGIVNGVISSQRLGNNGFGYDPIFIPDGQNRSFAQMTLDEKIKISHRSIATKKLVNFLNQF